MLVLFAIAAAVAALYLWVNQKRALTVLMSAAGIALFVLAIGVVSAPAAPQVYSPAVRSGATALCEDGTYSYASHHQGACSWHGGVAIFYR